MRVGGPRKTSAGTPCSPVFVTGEAADLLLLAARLRGKGVADYLEWLICEDAKRLAKLGACARMLPAGAGARS